MPVLQLPDTHLAYEAAGHGEQAVLFVHGSFASSRWWQPSVARLPADLYTAYMPDLQGCGRSGRPQDPTSYAIAHQAADLAALISALDLHRLHLVGHSMGAAIVLTYAVQHPERLRSLTLVSTPSPEGTPTPPEAYALLDEMRTDRSLLLRGLASTMPARPPDAFLQQLVDDAQGQAPAAFAATAEAMATWRLPAAALSQLRLPVLLMWGDQDLIVGRSVQTQLLLSIPGANNLEVFRGCGHTPMLERTEAFVMALRNFLEQDFEGYATIRDQAAEEG